MHRDGNTERERNQVINEYIRRLLRSGYQNRKVKSIVEAGLTGYERIHERESKGEVELHRDTSKNKFSRKVKKMSDKQNWIKTRRENTGTGKGKPKGNNNKADPAAVLFVDRTPNGSLCTALRQAEERLSGVCKTKVNILERTGETMSIKLTRSDLWPDFCPDKDCLVCQCRETTGPQISCRKRNIMYSTTFELCVRREGNLQVQWIK